MTGRLENKIALVCGAGSVGPGWGNGKAAAVIFAREGAKVFCVDLNQSAADETAALIRDEGGVAETFAADVADAADVAAMTEACMAKFGRIDILHNNVGISALGNVVDTTEADWDRVFAVNVKSVFLTVKTVLPIMQKQGKGAIVNVSSIGGIRYVGIPYVSYASSKAAVIQLTRNIAGEHAAQGIRCNAILPGLIDTPMVHHSLASHYGDKEDILRERDKTSPTGKMGTAFDIAYAALYLASDEAAYVNGVALVVDGGLSIQAGV